MWGKLVKWYDDWEEEQLAVLNNPALADTLPEGYRRYFGQVLAKLTPIERKQLHEFSITYRGRRLYLAVAKWALAFTVLGAALHLAFPAKVSWLLGIGLVNLAGFSLVFTTIGAWFNYRKYAGRELLIFAIFGGLSMLGGVTGMMMALADSGKPFTFDKFGITLLLATGAGMLMAAPFVIVGMLRNRQYEELTAELQRQAERDQMSRELSESKLRLLRAQIEPHFLFNTLGAVQQLAEHGAPRAAELTANLIAFLRASLSEMRCDEVGLGTEFGLLESYLKVMQARLGERLRYSLELPAALAAVNLPSMILLTLVENAIKHGIEPSLRGGEVTVRASAVDGKIRISVADTGVGMSLTPGSGIGLENVRHRLQLAYDDAASLGLHDGEESGMIAEIVMPQLHKESK
ncbi:MAG: histidine kinase [Pseudomonadota bacterium]